MLAAIIAAVVAVVVLVIAAIAVLAIRNRTKGSRVEGGKNIVRSIETVGVAPSANAETAAAPRSAPSRPGAANLAEGFKGRFTAMGVLAAAVFGSLAVRAWTMQALSGDRYRAEADQNQYTTVTTPAPRGCIYDAGGIELVRNRTSLTVLANVEVADDRTVVQRLSAVLGIPYNVVRQRIQDASTGAQSQRVVASGTALRNIAFISEHADAFPGVTTQMRAEREYPWGALAAHALGYTSAVTEEALEQAAEGQELEMGDEVGASGVEAAYNRYLAGSHGQTVVVADANGLVQRVVSESQPVKGNDLYLTIAAPVQCFVDRALAQLVAPDGVIGHGSGDSASAVVMDVTDGSIIALSSYPTFSPESFVGGISDDTWALYSSEEALTPLLNRAVAGQYPAASTFKAFTGLAGLAYGFADTERTWTCTGSWDGWNTGSPQKCWLHSGHGAMTFRDGVVQSCDTVFYEIAKDFYEAGQAGQIPETAMQDYVARYNFGKTTGLDIGGEQPGRIPTPEWKREYWRDYPPGQTWVGGDMTNMVIGQGDVLVTPLQVAVAYGGIATGQIMRPHLLKEVRNSEGEVVVTFQPEVVATPDVPAENLAVMRDALHGVATENADVASLFAAYGIDAAAKTGTAEHAGEGDSAWFVCYAPYDNPKYVVACQVNHGGGGSAVGAPLGVDIINATLAYERGELDITSMSAVAASTGESVPLENTSSGRTD